MTILQLRSKQIEFINHVNSLSTRPGTTYPIIEPVPLTKSKSGRTLAIAALITSNTRYAYHTDTLSSLLELMQRCNTIGIPTSLFLKNGCMFLKNGLHDIPVEVEDTNLKHRFNDRQYLWIYDGSDETYVDITYNERCYIISGKQAALNEIVPSKYGYNVNV